jgi:hypothetical protein
VVAFREPERVRLLDGELAPLEAVVARAASSPSLAKTIGAYCLEPSTGLLAANAASSTAS